MATVREYKCDCGCVFEKIHFEKPPQPPECPACQVLASQHNRIPAGFSIGTSKGQSLDIVQDVMEKDYGYTDFKDNLREGDVAVKSSPAIENAAAKFFNQGGSPVAPAATMPGVLAAAKASAALNRAEGRNPLGMLQRSLKAQGRQNARVICKPLNRIR